MKFTQAAAVAALAVSVDAASNETLCSKYTTALLKNNTGGNQYTLLTYLVNTVVAGNFTKPNVGVTFPDIAVPGILATFTGSDGKNTSLLPYFDGGLASSNRGGSSGVAVNFLDGGGATPLIASPPKPANDESSNQYMLLTHLYQFFGLALGCDVGSMGFPSYAGVASMYSVHKYMALNHDQMNYFISQVGLAAESFGVSSDDAKTVGNELNMLFNYRCSANATVVPSAGPVMQSICITSDCPEAQNSTCSAYPAVVEPGVANSTLAMGLGNSSSTATSAASGSMATGSMSGSMSGSMTATSSSVSATGAAVKNAVGGVAAGGLAMAAFFL